MEYTYRFKSFNGRHLPEKKTGKKLNGITVRFLVCVSIAAIACGVRLLFPEQTAEMLKRIGASIQYEKAVQAIGKAISGEERLDDALGETYTHGFGTESEDTQAFVEEETPSANRGENFDVAYKETVDVELEEIVMPTDGISHNEAVVAAFKESQSAYESYGVPTKATYDMPELTLSYICPVTGPVTSEFGYRTHPNDGVVRFHYGTDIGVPKGTEITAFADGVVKAVGNSSSYGKYIMIRHDENVVTMYAHCSEISVSEGESVLKGDKVAESGSTGNATGDCVHFEVIVNDKYVNPEYYVSWS